MLHTVGEMFREEAVSKGLELRVASGGGTVHASPLAVMRIISNLVSNAVKYTEQGGVLIGGRRRGSGAEIVVVDTGPGMTSEELQRFSESYQKGEASEGTGLGLSICYGLARAGDLDLAVRSAPGRGTCFRLRLPGGAAELGD